MNAVFATANIATAFTGNAVVRADERREDTMGAEDPRPGSWIMKTGG